MSGKIHPKKPVGGTQFGTTIENSDPAKFVNKGKDTGKIMSGSTVIDQKKGATWTANTTHIPSMNPSTSGKEKDVSEKSEPKFNPMVSKSNLVSQRTASASSGESTPSYPLKKEYRK